MAEAKYKVIAADIKAKIISGKYEELKAIPPEMQLQKDYDVSRHTIRQAISQLVNEGFLKKEQGSGTYVDNKFKQSKNLSKKNKTIGVITTYLSDYIFPSIIRGIEKKLSEQGYSVLISSTNNDFGQERECLYKMINHGVDGLIVEPTRSNQYNPNLALYVSLREQGIPVVMINAIYEEIDTPYICLDDSRGGFLAAEHLITNNHKRIIIVTKIDDLQGKYRMKGFIKACEQYKIPINIEDIITYETKNSEVLPDKILNQVISHPDITGIVCYNDQIARNLINKLSESDISVPSDISIVSNDNSYLSTIGDIKLTSINHPKECMGEDAAQWIIQAIKDNKTPDSILYEPKIIIRDSVIENI